MEGFSANSETSFGLDLVDFAGFEAVGDGVAGDLAQVAGRWFVNWRNEAIFR